MSNVLNQLAPSLLVTLVVLGCNAAFASTNFEFYSPGRAEKYGITYSGFANDAAQVSTQTTHHRFGQQTGIGSSTLQTESSTVESMPTVTYTPTAVSPDVVPSMRQPFQRVRIFSQTLLTTPTLSPVFTPLDTQADLFSHRDIFSSNLDRLRFIHSRTFDTFHIGEQGRGSPRGRYLDVQLTNPFSGLGD